MPDIRINEVGPRDGLQNIKQTIATEDKISFINALSDTGLSYIEATSFVSPQWVPQLADHKQVFEHINKKTSVRYPVLIPNLQGLEAALECGVTDIAVFTAASEKFSQKNTNCSIKESLKRIADIMSLAKQHDINSRAYISCVIACPYAGKTDAQRVLDISLQLLELGCYEISLGDTIGIGTAKEFERLLSVVLQHVDADKLALHCHDTHNQALNNIRTGIDMGLRSFDSSIHGLGGCPYAPGANGNVATEKVVELCHSLSLDTGIDLETLKAVPNL